MMWYVNSYLHEKYAFATHLKTLCFVIRYKQQITFFQVTHCAHKLKGNMKIHPLIIFIGISVSDSVSSIPKTQLGREKVEKQYQAN